MSKPIHDAAAVGFEAQVDSYASARPSYEPALVDRLVGRLGTNGWIDLGAGTGLFTQLLVERDVQVTAIEPVAAMRDRLAATLAGIPVLDGTASAMPISDGSAAVIVAATAFHWFDHGPALTEIDRVLAPGGALVTIWNTRDDSIPWMAEYTRIGDSYAGDTPRYKTMIWRTAIEGRMELEHEERVPNPRPTTADKVAKRLLSTSFIAALDPAGQAEAEAQVRAAVADQGDTFDFAYITEVQVWRRPA